MTMRPPKRATRPGREQVRHRGSPFALVVLAMAAVGPLTAAVAADPARAAAPFEIDRQALDQILGGLLGQRGASPPPASPAAPAVPLGPVSGEVKVDAGGRVDVHVSNMPIGEVLRMIAEQTRRNIVLSAGVQGTVSADLYGVTLEQALEGILRAHRFVHRQSGPFVYVYTKDEWAAIDEAERPVETRVFPLRYVNAKDVSPLILPLLSTKGKLAVTPPSDTGLGSANASGASGGGQSTGGDSHANAEAIVVTDVPETVALVARVLSSIDLRPRQVLVEATILRAQLNEDNALGIDFTTVGGIDFTELSSVSPGVQSIATGLVPAEKLQETTLTARTNFNGAVPAGGFTFGIIKDQISAFIRALEQVTDLAVLANPKVLALNKQKGEVIVGRRDGYLTTTVTETTAVQTVEFLETGTRLLFRPFVLDDQTVRMEIHPEDSTGGVTAANLPFKQTTEVTTNILVRDGHTILIGGLFREVNDSTRGQIPLLGNIPIAGGLFRTTSDGLTREEIIILLTVRIVKGEPDEQASDELGDDVERVRVGQRKSAQWLGRERISQAHYQWAVKHLANGNFDQALWDAAIAIRNNPHHLQALELREQILQRRAWDEESSAVRHHLKALIGQEKGDAKPVFGRPAPPFEWPDDEKPPAEITTLNRDDAIRPAPIHAGAAAQDAAIEASDDLHLSPSQEDAP